MDAELTQAPQNRAVIGGLAWNLVEHYTMNPIISPRPVFVISATSFNYLDAVSTVLKGVVGR